MKTTQIIDLEKKYWKAMEDHDFKTVKSLTHFPCIVAGKNGVQSVDEDGFKKMFESGANAHIKMLNMLDTKTLPIGEDSAVIAYKAELGPTSGQSKTPTQFACASTWVKENGNWTCALHTESELVQ